MFTSSISGHAKRDNVAYMNDDHLLRLKFDTNVYELTTQTDGNGSLSASVYSGLSGQNVSLVPTPNANYQFASFESTGCNINSSAFNFQDTDCTAKANFELKPGEYKIGSWLIRFSNMGDNRIIDTAIPSSVYCLNTGSDTNPFTSAGLGWRQWDNGSDYPDSVLPVMHNFIYDNRDLIYKDAGWSGTVLTAKPNTFSIADNAKIVVTAGSARFVTLSAGWTKFNLMCNDEIVHTYTSLLNYTFASEESPLVLTGTPTFTISSDGGKVGFYTKATSLGYNILYCDFYKIV